MSFRGDEPERLPATGSDADVDVRVCEHARAQLVENGGRIAPAEEASKERWNATNPGHLNFHSTSSSPHDQGTVRSVDP